MIASDPQVFIDWNAKASAFVASLREGYQPSSWVRSDLPGIREPFGTEPYFSEIAFGRPLKAIPPAYKRLVADWQAYLSKTAGLTIRITMDNAKTGEPFTKTVPYVHQFTSVYRKSILAKLYALEAYLGPDVRDVEMITLTTHQRGRDPRACMLQLKADLKRLLDLMRKRFGTVDYFYMLEPHETGYPHAHMAYFKKLTDAEKSYLMYAWSCVIEAGNLANGLHFSEPRASQDGKHEAGSIGGIRNYFMKYISKGLYAPEMTPAEQLFNAIRWDSKTRLWGCSRNFSKVMARPVTEANPDWQFREAFICDADGNALSKVTKKFKPTDDDLVKWDELIEAARSEAARFQSSSSPDSDACLSGESAACAFTPSPYPVCHFPFCLSLSRSAGPVANALLMARVSRSEAKGPQPSSGLSLSGPSAKGMTRATPARF